MAEIASVSPQFYFVKRCPPKDCHFTWSDRDWHLGLGFARFDDPTNALGSGDDDGQPVAAPADGQTFFGSA